MTINSKGGGILSDDVRRELDSVYEGVMWLAKRKGYGLSYQNTVFR